MCLLILPWPVYFLYFLFNFTKLCLITKIIKFYWRNNLKILNKNISPKLTIQESHKWKLKGILVVISCDPHNGALKSFVWSSATPLIKPLSRFYSWLLVLSLLTIQDGTTICLHCDLYNVHISCPFLCLIYISIVVSYSR